MALMCGPSTVNTLTANGVWPGAYTARAGCRFAAVGTRSRSRPQGVVWDAITQPEYSAAYLYGALVETTGEVGKPFRYHSPDRTELWGDETVLDADPGGVELVPDLGGEEPSRVTWHIGPAEANVCPLTVVHDRLGRAPKTAERVAGPGWMRVLSGLKTVLETGQPLNA